MGRTFALTLGEGFEAFMIVSTVDIQGGRRLGQLRPL
jgi:hypothetical protein